MEYFPTRPWEEHDDHVAHHRLVKPRQQRTGVVMSFGEATFWHNHPDLPRLAQDMRERMEHQTTASD